MDSELIRGAMLSHGMEPEMDDGMQGRFANFVVYGLGSLGLVRTETEPWMDGRLPNPETLNQAPNPATLG